MREVKIEPTIRLWINGYDENVFTIPEAEDLYTALGDALGKNRPE